MNILENIIITLSEQDINEIIVKELKSKGFTVVGKVNINIGTKTVGYGLSEHDITEFKNITCTASKIENNE